MAAFFHDESMSEVLKRLIKQQMQLKAYGYKELSEKLASRGVQQSPSNLSSKVSRGTLGAPLLMHMLAALGVDQLNINELDKLYREINEEKRR